MTTEHPPADGSSPPVARRRVPERLDVRPLDRFRSFKVKLGILVGAVVLVAALLTQVSIRAGIEPLLAIPLVVIAALVFTQLLARGMTSPLREITAAARAMARGDYTQRIRSSSRDEIGQLAEAFSTMASELEQTDRMRRDLVANVSHELRTPVAGLRAQLENLVDGVTEPDPAALEVALTETERLSLLVNHLLDLSRLDAGVVELDLEDIELTPFLHEVVDAATLASGGRDVRWIVDVEPADLMVTADAAAIRTCCAPSRIAHNDPPLAPRRGNQSHRQPRIGTAPIPRCPDQHRGRGPKPDRARAHRRAVRAPPGQVLQRT